MQNHFGLLDTDVMPIFMIISLDIVITLHFSINCSTVICSPTVIISILREASSETHGPGVYFNHIIKAKNTMLQFIYFYFVLQFIHLLIPDLILAINKYKGIDNPLARFGCKYFLLFVHVLFIGVCVILLLVQ